jgi:hypothetical protein
MPPKRTYPVQLDGLAFSRPRRENIKAPRRPDDNEATAPTDNGKPLELDCRGHSLTSFVVPEHVTKRQAHEKRKEKNAIAAEIEADPLASDDEPAHEELPEWIPPTFTGGKLDWYTLQHA